MKMANLNGLKQQTKIYFAAAFLISWIIWLPALLIQNFGLYLPISSELFIRVGGFAPSVSGFVLAFVFGGKAEVRFLLSSLINVHIKLKWLFFIFLVLPGVSAASCVIFTLAGGIPPQPEFPLWFIPIAFVYILVLMGPLGEEAGWRGFALKRMLRSLNPFKSAVLLGIVWTLWHLPLFFIKGTTQNLLAGFGLLPALFCYLLYTVMISILITLLYIMNGGSVFATVLFHTMGNLSLGLVPLILSKIGAVILLLVLFIVSAVIIYRYREILFMKEINNE